MVNNAYMATPQVLVLPYMASIIGKKKGNKTYYYVATSGRVDGNPRITHQTYLGTAEHLARLVKDRTAPVPLEATARDCGLPATLFPARQRPLVGTVSKSIGLATPPKALPEAHFGAPEVVPKPSWNCIATKPCTGVI